MAERFCRASWVVLLCCAATPVLALSVEGTVREKGTRAPIPGAFVGVAGSDLLTVTDEQGAFVLVFGDGAVQSTTLEVDTTGYQRSVQVVTLRRDRSTTSVDIFLEKTEGSETRLRERRSRDNIARGAHRIEGNEVNEMPGTYGDPAKAIENFPGMGRVLLSQGSLFVRGAQPNESAIFVDDYEVPDLYHYTGSTSVINIPFVESVELVPGAFSARYGRSIGGIVTLRTKKLPTDDIHGFAKLDTIDGGAYVGVPITDKLAIGASGRRSWLDLARDAQKQVRGTGDEVLLTPTYWDYQLKLDWDTAPGHELVVFAFGSGDREVYASDGSGALDPYLRTNDSDFHRLSLRYQHGIGGGLVHTFTPVLGFARSDLVEQGGLRRASRTTSDVQVRDELVWRSGNTRVTVGVDTTARHDTFVYGGLLASDPGERVPSADLTTAASRPDVTLTSWRLTGGAYLEGSLEPLDRVFLTPGVRVEGMLIDGAPHVTFEPRLAGSYQVTKGPWGTTLKVGAGAFSRPPDADEVAVAAQQQVRLPVQQALQVQGAFEQDIASRVTFSTTLFSVWRDGLTNRNNAFPTSNSVLSPPVTATASTHSMGAEILARTGVPKSYFLWLTYSLVRTERRDGGSPLGIHYAYQPPFDTTHLLGVVGQFHLWWGFRLGARYRIANGMPQDTIAGSMFDGDTGRFIPLFGPRNNARYPLFNVLDVRLDWQKTLDYFELDFYADLANVSTVAFGRPVEGTYYGYDFAQTAPRYGLPLVPAIGLKALF